jgi:hypothetical protein
MIFSKRAVSEVDRPTKFIHASTYSLNINFSCKPLTEKQGIK